MTARPPEFHELVGDDLSPEEAERLRRAHDLLVAAGPLPELPPALEEPRLGERPQRIDQGMFQLLPRRRAGAALALAAAIALVAFLGGYLAGYRKDQNGLDAVARVTLSGTGRDPNARAVVLIGQRDASGNLPMRVTARGLKPLPASGYYTLSLVKHGKPVVTCGTFRVRPGEPTSVRMAVAYDVGDFDGWVVTEYKHGRKAQPVVLSS